MDAHSEATDASAISERRDAVEADGPLLTRTEAMELGEPDGQRWDPDYDAPIGADGQRPGRFVPITGEHVEAERRDKERRRLLADAPPGPRLVPEQRSPAPCQAAPRQAAPRRANGQGGRPRARSSRSAPSSGDDDPDGDDGPPGPKAQASGRLAADLLEVVRDARSDVGTARALLRSDSLAAPPLDRALERLGRIADRLDGGPAHRVAPGWFEAGAAIVEGGRW